MVELIDEQLTSLRNEIREHLLLGPASTREQDDDSGDMPFADGLEDKQDATQGQQARAPYRVYIHGGQMWQVPSNFTFPDGVTLESNWLEVVDRRIARQRDN